MSSSYLYLDTYSTYLIAKSQRWLHAVQIKFQRFPLFLITVKYSHAQKRAVLLKIEIRIIVVDGTRSVSQGIPDDAGWSQMDDCDDRKSESEHDI